MRTFYTRMNNHNFTGTWCIVIADLFPWSDQDNCMCPKKIFFKSTSFLFLFICTTWLCVQSNQLWKKTFQWQEGRRKKTYLFIKHGHTNCANKTRAHWKKNTAIWQIQLKSKQGRQHDSITFNLFFYCSSSCIWVGSIKLYVYQTFLITVDKISLSLLYFKIYIISDRKI